MSQDKETPAQLTLLREQYADQAQRDAVEQAYYAFATGDPETFPVRFSVLVAANADLLKAYPGRLKKIFELELRNLEEVISSQHEPVTRAATTFEKHTLIAGQLVDTLQEQLQDQARHVADERKANASEWSLRLADLQRECRDIRTETRRLYQYKLGFILACALGSAFMGGGIIFVMVLMLHWL